MTCLNIKLFLFHVFDLDRTFPRILNYINLSAYQILIISHWSTRPHIRYHFKELRLPYHESDHSTINPNTYHHYAMYIYLIRFVDCSHIIPHISLDSPKLPYLVHAYDHFKTHQYSLIDSMMYMLQSHLFNHS